MTDETTPKQPKKRLLTHEEAAAHAGIGIDTLKALVSLGRLAPILDEAGEVLGFAKADLDAL